MAAARGLAAPGFAERVERRLAQLSPAERAVVAFFQANREEVLVASALDLARAIGTSDATVVRTVKALGYAGFDALRRQLADELRASQSPAARIARTLGEVRGDTGSALDLTLDIHLQALERLRQDIAPALFRSAVDRIAAAARVAVFGIGPSSAMASYFAIQLGRFGIDSAALTDTGLLFADDLLRLKRGDLVIVLAYGRVYAEVDALIDQAGALGGGTILLTDTLGATLSDRVDLVLPVARGRADWFSMHTTTLGLIEALLVGVAARRPAETVAQLKRLNDLRARVVGRDMDLPVANGIKKRPRQSRSKRAR